MNDQGADLRSEPVLDGVEGAAAPPFVEVAPEGALERCVVGQVIPLATSAADVEDGFHHVPQVSGAGPTAGVDGDQVLDERLLLVGYVTGVRLGSHKPFCAPKYPS